MGTLEKLKIALAKYKMDIHKAVYSKTSKSYQKTKDEIIALAKNLQISVPPDEYKTQYLYDISYILNVLEENAQEVEEKNQWFELLEEAQKEVREINQSSRDYTEKIEALKEWSAKISAEESRDEEITFERNDLLKLIESFVTKYTNILEFSRLVQSLQEYPYPCNYVQQKIRLKIDEIVKWFTENPKGVESILHEVPYILHILDKNASEYEKLVQCLEFLEQIGMEIIAINNSTLSRVRKKQELVLRITKIFSVKTLNSTITAKKKEILNRLPKEMFEQSQFDRRELEIIKALVDEYANEVTNFTFPKTSYTYLSKRKEVEALAENINDITEGNEEKQYLLNAIDNILKTLDVNAENNEIINQNFTLLENIDNDLTKISKSNLNCDEKLTVFEKCLQQVQSIQCLGDDFLQAEKVALLDKVNDLKINARKNT